MAESIEKLQAKRKSGALAAGLNLVLPGVGYMYCGRIFLGIVVLPFVAIMLFAMPMAAVPIWAVLIIDGFLAANRYNELLDQRVANAMKVCPRCAEKVLPEAKVCKHCQHEFEAKAA